MKHEFDQENQPLLNKDDKPVEGYERKEKLNFN